MKAILLILIFSNLSSVAYGTTDQEFRAATGFTDGSYHSLEESDNCLCEEFELTNYPDEGLKFFSLNCMAIYPIGGGKKTWKNHQCNYEATARLLGKTLTYMLTKRCGKKDLKKYPNGTSDQKDRDTSITINFVEGGFDYEIRDKIIGSKEKVEACKMRNLIEPVLKKEK